MKMSKIFKTAISTMLSLAILTSLIIIPGVSAETTQTDYNLVTNGSFESDLTSGWNTTTFADFSSVTATDEGITAVDGSKVLKIDTQKGWNYRLQDIAVETNTDYTLSFWVYRVNSSSTSVYKFGTPSNDQAIKTQVYLNNETVGQWVNIKLNFNSGDYETVRLVFCAHTSISYIDNVSIKKIVNITATADDGGAVSGLPTDTVLAGDSISLTATENIDLTAKFTADSAIVSDGGFEDGVLNSAWIHSTSSGGALSITSDDKYEGECSAVITPVSGWQNSRYALTVKANTDYVVRFAAKNAGSSKAVIKVASSASSNILDGAPSNGNYEINAGTSWGTMTYTFNSGDYTSLTLYLTGPNTNVKTYIDNFEILEKCTVTATASAGGTVSGVPTASVVVGDSVTLTATPDVDYEFTGWYNGETKVSDSAEYTFTVSESVNLTAQFKAIDYNEGLVVNGSFERDLTSGWNATTFADFSSVSAADEGITAIDGSKVLKIDTKTAWNYRRQDIAVETNTDYMLSFWVYRVNSSSSSVYKFGIPSNDQAIQTQTYLNNETVGKWVNVKVNFNSGDYETVRLVFCAYAGVSYIDDVQIIKLGNYVINGDFESQGAGLNGWLGSTNSTQFAYDTATSHNSNASLKITGNEDVAYDYIQYKVTVEKNTDYVLSFYAKNTNSAGMRYKVTQTSNTNVSLIGGDKDINADTETWKLNRVTFNSGENTSIYIAFYENRDNTYTTYVDDIYLGKKVNVTAVSSNDTFGSVTASDTVITSGKEVTYTATATAGGNFLGWKIGDSESLTAGTSLTLAPYSDTTVTAVFEAKLGNVNLDGTIDSQDIAELKKCILKINSYAASGDMNQNGSNDILDLVLLDASIQ